MNVLFGVTGGIAAYKAADIISALKTKGHTIKVIMTEKAKEFITPLTLSSLSKNPIYDDKTEWAPHGRIDHIELPEWADIFIVAPATANTIAKLVHGIADNLLTSTYLAFNCNLLPNKRFIFCPAMNTRMYEDENTKNNFKVLLQKSNHTIIPAVEGFLACGAFGIGKLAPTKTIVDYIERLTQELK